MAGSSLFAGEHMGVLRIKNLLDIISYTYYKQQSLPQDKQHSQATLTTKFFRKNFFFLLSFFFLFFFFFYLRIINLSYFSFSKFRMEKQFGLEQTDREESLVNSDCSCKIENVSKKFKFCLKDKKVVVDHYFLFLEGKSTSLSVKK
jgi:uncharacterized protein YpmS